MAHNIAKIKGKDAFVSVKEIAWHKLGTIVDKQMTSSECIVHAGLDYEVELLPAFVKRGNKYLPIPGTNGTARTDTDDVFGTVGSRYHVVQNKDAFEFFDSIVGEGAAVYETAGALGDGERIFITAKLPDDIIVGKDCIRQYLFLTTAHDGSGAVHGAFTPVRIVCNNTLQMALRQSRRAVSIRHTTGAQQKLRDAHKLMGITARNSKTLSEALNAIAKVKISDAQLRRFIELAMSPQREQIDEKEFSQRFVNTIDEIMEYAHVHPTQLTKETKGTLYGALHAVTGYFQNVKEYKDDEKAVRSIIYGTAKRKSAFAMSVALDALTSKSILS
jgi:phage/plasmid-like protein (TIGR03299 family)